MCLQFQLCGMFYNSYANTDPSFIDRAKVDAREAVLEGTALQASAAVGNAAIVQTLLDKGADIEAKDYRGNTALYSALRHKKVDVIRVLLDRDANVLNTSDLGAALYSWTRFGQEGIVEKLLNHGADIEAITTLSSRYTALHVASYNGHEVIARLLLAKGADSGATNHRGQTALHLASIAGHITVIRILLEGGLDIEAKEFRGQTALHLASENGQEALVRLLLEHGADTGAMNKAGHTALDQANTFLLRALRAPEDQRSRVEGFNAVISLLTSWNVLKSDNILVPT